MKDQLINLLVHVFGVAFTLWIYRYKPAKQPKWMLGNPCIVRLDSSHRTYWVPLEAPHWE